MNYIVKGSKEPKKQALNFIRQFNQNIFSLFVQYLQIHALTLIENQV